MRDDDFSGMTVSGLIEALKKCPPDLPVCYQYDSNCRHIGICYVGIVSASVEYGEPEHVVLDEDIDNSSVVPRSSIAELPEPAQQD